MAEYLAGFMLPTTLGNIVGGVLLVALLNYGQVWGSASKGQDVTGGGAGS